MGSYGPDPFPSKPFAYTALQVLCIQMVIGHPLLDGCQGQWNCLNVLGTVYPNSLTQVQPLI